MRRYPLCDFKLHLSFRMLWTHKYLIEITGPATSMVLNSRTQSILPKAELYARGPPQRVSYPMTYLYLEATRRQILQ
jgi:hypothetical protein